MSELESLLEPISEASPCGEDLSFSTDFDSIKEASRADDPSLDQGEWVTDLKTADWAAVRNRCTTLLRQRSKDIRLGVWLSEAWARTEGFAGLATGYRLIAQMCERYWQDLHPQDEDAEYGQRIGNLAWLLNSSSEWMRGMVLIEAPQGKFTFNDFLVARSRARRGSEDDGQDGSPPSLAVLEMARLAASFEFYSQLAATLPDCKAALTELEQVVDAHLGNNGPSFSATRDMLGSIVDMGLRFAKDAGVHIDGLDDPAETQTGGSRSGSSPRDGELNRNEALAQLRRVAEFFRRTEPHSPVAYLADKAARWGTMPLHVWLKKVIKDGNSLAHIEELLDVDSKASND